jgi:serine/threonine protein kinase
MLSPVKVLGEGGFAAVKLCIRLSDQYECAVKHVVYQFDDVDDSYAIKARTEFWILWALSGHDGFVHVYDFYENKFEAFIVMEHLKGITLTECIQKEIKLSTHEIKDIVL